MENMLLSLESNRWSELEHAYGNASDIPKLLKQLAEVPDSSGNKEPWFTLWSSLAHQGNVYTASFAAVPHIIYVIAVSPLKVDYNYFQFPAWVELCRIKNNVSIPKDIAPAYFEALSQLPALVSAVSTREWDDIFLSCILSALAASKGQVRIAEAALELSADVAAEFMEWFSER